MLPYLEEIARAQGIESEDFLSIVSIGQSFPGAMGINVAAIIGYRMQGWVGSLLAILGVLIPSMISAGVLFYLLGMVSHISWIKVILTVLKAAMVGVILAMALNLGQKSWIGTNQIVIGLAALMVFYFMKINPIFLLLGGGVSGYFLLQTKVKA
jgi:chromate transporter